MRGGRLFVVAVFRKISYLLRSWDICLVLIFLTWYDTFRQQENPAPLHPPFPISLDLKFHPPLSLPSILFWPTRILVRIKATFQNAFNSSIRPYPTIPHTPPSPFWFKYKGTQKCFIIMTSFDLLQKIPKYSAALKEIKGTRENSIVTYSKWQEILNWWMGTGKDGSLSTLFKDRRQENVTSIIYFLHLDM